jgi:hypothetical protein
VPSKKVLRTTLTLGTPLMMSQSFIKEKTLSPDQVLEENPFNQEALSSSSLEDTEEEES